MGTDVEFYFDYTSPNAYFGYKQMKRLRQRMDFTLSLRPVFLGGIMNELETTPPGFQNRPKTDYLTMDLQRWASFHDMPFTFPDEFPVDSLKALRGFLALEDEGTGVLESYTNNVFEAVWSENRDPSDTTVLRDCLPSGVDPERFLSRVEDENVKDDLRRRTDEALDRGVFGCPMIYVEDEPFWGKDRMKLVEDRIRNADD